MVYEEDRSIDLYGSVRGNSTMDRVGSVLLSPRCLRTGAAHGGLWPRQRGGRRKQAGQGPSVLNSIFFKGSFL